jgi:predicted 3-demethylubiquinone-9 3-methyltransferase (glyoxalase superfamily)
MQKITPFLWFEKDASAIADFYLSVFKDGKILEKNTMGDTPSGTVEIITMSLLGQEFTIMSAGPLFKFTEAVSFVISCEDQAEVDYYWDKLSADPKSEQCGWLKDKYGLSWQVVPKDWSRLLKQATPEQAARLTQAMLKMKKFDIAALEAAYQGK